MPQFDFANVFVPQIVWLAFFFAVLYFAVVLPTLPKIGRVMQAREDQVSGDLNSAEAAKASADALVAAHEEEIARAQEAVRVALGAARDKAAKASETRLAKADAKLGEQAMAAEASLNEARAKAMAEIEAVAADLAADLVEKLTGKRPATGTTARPALG